MSIAKDVLTAEFSKSQGIQAQRARERFDRMGRLLAMGDRWLVDNEAQVRQEFPELFPPVPTEADIERGRFDIERGRLEAQAGGKDALIDKLLAEAAVQELSEEHRATAVREELKRLIDENAGLRAQIDEIHAAKASDEAPVITPDLPTA